MGRDLEELLPPPPILLTLHGNEAERQSFYDIFLSRKQSFYNLLHNRYETSCRPILFDRVVLGSAFGWLVLLKPLEGNCCLWNPTSDDVIQLPDLGPHPLSYGKCLLSKPPTEPGCLIAFNQHNLLQQRFYRSNNGDGEFEDYFELNTGNQVLDMVAFRGVIYGIVTPGYEFVTIAFEEDAIRVTPLLSSFRVPTPRRAWATEYKHYLIESNNELLLVTKMHFDYYLNDAVQFRVFRVGVGKMEREELDNLDGRTVFISFYGNGICRESFGEAMKPNSIYYTNRHSGRVIYVYDMDDRSSVTLLPCPDADVDPYYSQSYWVDLQDIPRRMSYWGELDGDLLDMILSNLFGNDRLSFSLVCRHWNSIAVSSPCQHSRYLMHYYHRTRTWRFNLYNTLFSVSFPELQDSEIRCSKHGWLLMCRHDGTLFFFDPSNIQTITLPCKAEYGYSSLTFFNPPTSPECVVVGIKSHRFKCGKVVTCTLKRGEDEWESTEHLTDEHYLWVSSLASPVLHRGLIYFLSTNGDVATLDIEQRKLDVHYECMRRNRNDMAIKEHYMVKAKIRGDREALFGVFVYKSDGKVNVFRLSDHKKWHPAKGGIGGKVMYVSHMSSFVDTARNKSMENTIWFPKLNGDDDVVFYSLSDAKYHSLVGREYSESNAYGLKHLHFSAWLMTLPSPELVTNLSWI